MKGAIRKKNVFRALETDVKAASTDLCQQAFSRVAGKSACLGIILCAGKLSIKTF